ncbi:uncharacterized protein LOC103749912 isoform X2 [Nannospalax galili]|uniref:uncharacterized protein LOC103749912 isoform X2 n=1 Tax=Nannospalax galili TaxID=1026970 RepID=UPI00111C6600|nr:uncharacterized protein LOC103749912 isoform X2 [Nannospalax galili]
MPSRRPGCGMLGRPSRAGFRDTGSPRPGPSGSRERRCHLPPARGPADRTAETEPGDLPLPAAEAGVPGLAVSEAEMSDPHSHVVFAGLRSARACFERRRRGYRVRPALWTAGAGGPTQTRGEQEAGRLPLAFALRLREAILRANQRQQDGCVGLRSQKLVWSSKFRILPWFASYWTLSSWQMGFHDMLQGQKKRKRKNSGDKNKKPPSSLVLPLSSQMWWDAGSWPETHRSSVIGLR